MKYLVLLVILLAFAVSGQAAIYKWVDANGVVTFKDTLPPQGVEAEKVEPAPSFIDHSPVPAAGKESSASASTASGTPRAAQPQEGRVVKPSRLPKVELFTTSWCPYCVKAKQYLNALRIPYTEYDMEKTPRAREIRRRYDNGTGIPLAIIGDVKVRGFDPATYDRALGIRRVN